MGGPCEDGRGRDAVEAALEDIIPRGVHSSDLWIDTGHPPHPFFHTVMSERLKFHPVGW